jgi:uncharacterized protein (DUF2225 family)
MADTTKRGYFYAKAYTCVFCGAEFQGYRLYPTARDRIEKWDDYFDHPLYEEKDAAGNPTDYSCVEVKVCSACAFASNDDAHFLAERQESKWEPETAERETVRRLAPDRKAIAQQAAKLHSFPRDPSDALVAFKLAIHSSTALFNANARRNAVETVRMANYALKCAVLSARMGQPERVDVWRKAALEYFKRAFESELKGVTLYRTVYQLGALAIYFSDDRSASRSFEYLRQLYAQEPVRDLHRYMERLRKIWEDREHHRAKA